MALSAKQKRFADEYLIDFNATQAAIRAGYSPKTAKTKGSQLLTIVDVAAYVHAEQDKQTARTRVSADRVVKELSRVAFSDMRNYVKWGPDGIALKDSDELSTDDSAAVTEVSETTRRSGGKTMKLKLAHKDSALKALAQHTGLFDRGTGQEGEEFERLLDAIKGKRGK